jgi:epoxyqueuosine reductase
VKQTALDCGFDLAGIASAEPVGDYARFREWVSQGRAGEMTYLTDHRADLRRDPHALLPGVKTVLCVGKVYSAVGSAESLSMQGTGRGWISRYAWGRDYHEALREALGHVVERLRASTDIPFESRICVDTAPLLERSYARMAGLGWIGRNTCLINEQHGSWLFLGELLLTTELAADKPAPDRCGTCRRCIDACPTDALVPKDDGTWALDARLCISYFTIEKRGPIPAEYHSSLGHHVFGCDICQEVCPWNGKAGRHNAPHEPPEDTVVGPELAQLADMTQDEFRRVFRHTPVSRAKYGGFLRNVAIAMGNSGRREFLEPLERLCTHPDATVRESAEQARRRLEN